MMTQGNAYGSEKSRLHTRTAGVLTPAQRHVAEQLETNPEEVMTSLGKILQCSGWWKIFTGNRYFSPDLILFNHRRR